MRIKADWNRYLQKIRSREFATVFSNCPKKTFDKALELGAGDGFISTLLSDYVGSLVSTDIDRQRLQRRDYANVTYRTCDAEHVGKTFGEKEFDLVFSSNLLEHLPDCLTALR